MATRILIGDVRDRLKELPDQSVHCCVTSPPYYGLRDYGVPGQLGLESTLAEYITNMVDVFRDVRRVLRDDGVCFVNIGDSYAGGGGFSSASPSNQPGGSGFASDRPNLHKALIKGGRSLQGLKTKDLMLVPERLALALQDDGWWVRSRIIWAKKACMPESVTDRPTNAHEHIWLLTKAARYFYDAEAVREDSIEERPLSTWESRKASGEPIRRGDPGQSGHITRTATLAGVSGRNQRNVWHLGPEPFTGWTPVSRQIPVAWDEADDDTTRTPSPDCPLHGSRDHQDSSQPGDGRVGDASSRNAHNGDHRALGRPGGYVPIALIDDEGSPVGNSDSPLLTCSPTANGHNTESRKTDSPSASYGTTGEQTPCRIGCNEPSHDSPEPDGCCIPDSSETLGHTSHSGTCTCSFFKTVTESISHFATFPTEIPRRAIKAGTSEHGCCEACGAPWVRQTEHEYVKSPKHGAGSVVGRHYETGSNGWDGAGYPRLNKQVSTTGWEPSCQCDAGVIPCTVMDIFGGSGTTGMVADQLGRDCYLIELNPEYVEIARKRITGDAPMFAAVSVEPATRATRCTEVAS